MSPRVQLVLYPDDVGVRVHYDVGPPDRPAGPLRPGEGDRSDPEAPARVLSVGDHRVEPSDHSDYEATWHVYRDGELKPAIEQPA